MPKIAKKQLKSKQIFARLIAGSSSQTTEVREGVSSARSEVLSSVPAGSAGSARRSPESVERIAHPPEGYKITANISFILNLYK